MATSVEWVPERLLAEGPFGRVYRGTYQGAVPAAVKVRQVRTPDEAWRGEAEVKLLQRLQREPCVLHMLHGAAGTAEVVTVHELCGASAQALLDAGETLPVGDVMLSLCSAVAALHGLDTPVAHRCLTLDRVFSTAEPAVWKLAGLESATAVAWRCVTPTHVAIGYDEVERFTTPACRPPELIDLWRGTRCDQQVDLWGLGVALYRLLYGAAPFDDDSPLAVLNRAVAFPDAARPADTALVEALLSKHPTHRLDVWTLLRRLLDERRGSRSWHARPAPERPRGWREMPLAPWCDTAKLLTESSKLLVTVQATLTEPYIAPDTPKLGAHRPPPPARTEGFESMVEDVMDLPLVDDYEETLRTHLVTEESVGLAAEAPRLHGTPPPAAALSPQAREGRRSTRSGARRKPSVSPQRNMASKVKDWVERKGISSAALSLFHQSNGLHACVIRATDDTMDPPRTLYVDKLALQVTTAPTATLPKTVALLFHYLALRPLHTRPLVAYKSMFMLHHVLQAAPLEALRVVHSGHRGVFAEVAGKWGSPLTQPGPGADAFPLLHSIAERYATYLRKFLRVRVGGGGFKARNDDGASGLAEVYIAGVQVLKRLLREAGDGAKQAKMFCPAVVKLLRDLQAIERGLDAAPQTGDRMKELAPHVATAQGFHEKCLGYAKAHLPETTLVLAAEEEAGGVSLFIPAAGDGGSEDVHTDDDLLASCRSSAVDPSEGRREFEDAYLPMFVHDTGALGEDVSCLSIAQLAAVPGNDLCFDCGRRAVQFGSSLGVFLCDLCNPYHADVPADRTKSIFLDGWDRAEVEHMYRIGNARAKLVWLGRQDAPVPPDPVDNPVQYRAYIQRKYVEKAYVGDVEVIEHRLRAMSKAREVSRSDLRTDGGNESPPGSSVLGRYTLPATPATGATARGGGSPAATPVGHGQCLFPATTPSPRGGGPASPDAAAHAGHVTASLDDLFQPSALSSLPQQRLALPDAQSLTLYYDAAPANAVVPPPVTSEPSFVLP
eukprot:TRINITY_DN27813_c0_g1_i1.p1 TRINITY_DN27813_c0_g1~~TRINITY_DN27813_c0_g1_i1.p1  ORF type:complete len:1007 (+),score=348.85 TRINITY_DN27813_c0_g1_i1:69-3089(+)